MLTKDKIIKCVKKGTIIIEPFILDHCGPNSYDVRLAEGVMEVYSPDSRRVLQGYQFDLYPETLYLGATMETTISCKYIPKIETRSSIARQGVSIHLSAGLGDLGWGYDKDGQPTYPKWTLEITCINPVTLIAGQRIGQVSFYKPVGKVKKKYLYAQTSGKYNHQQSPQVAIADRERE